jgi:hypothetical protein
LLAVTIFAATACGRSTHVEILASIPAAAPGAAWTVEKTAYEKAVKQAFRQGWHVVVAPISDHSLTEEPLVSVDFPSLSAMGLTQGQFSMRMLGPAEQRARTALSTIRARSNSKQRTEIIAAVLASSDRFTDDAQREKLLVILSTGFEQSSFLNMGDYRLDLNDRVGERIIEHLKTVGAFPRLKGVRVCMAGITSGKNDWADPIRARNVKHFWHRFFSAAGADLVLYDVSIDGCSLLFS